ncbi:MAG: tellurite resistance TerB family protein, partial [Steroidobacteraceae bacterium]|nr:tellurite resistance TerB family protein [Steroidobacteraceae bacterium]
MDTKKLIDALTRNPAAAGALGGLAGSLLGSVLTGGKVKAGGLLKAGGLATIGYLAYQAWQRHQAQKAGLAVTEPERRPAAASAPAALPEAFDLLATSHATQALQVVRAMVAAAKADGVVDAAEQTRIAERVRTAGLSSEEQAQVLKLLTEPLNIDAVVSGV